MNKHLDTRLKGFRISTVATRDNGGEWETLAEKGHEQAVARLWLEKFDRKGEKAEDFHKRTVAFIKGHWISPKLGIVDEFMRKERVKFDEFHK